MLFRHRCWIVVMAIEKPSDSRISSLSCLNLPYHPPEDGWSNYCSCCDANGVCCQIEPFSTSIGRQVCLAEFHQSAECYWRKKCPAKHFPPMSLVVAPQIFSPKHQTESSIHQHVRPLVCQRDIFHQANVLEWEEREKDDDSQQEGCQWVSLDMICYYICHLNFQFVANLEDLFVILHLDRHN